MADERSPLLQQSSSTSPADVSGGAMAGTSTSLPPAARAHQRHEARQPLLLPSPIPGSEQAAGAAGGRVHPGTLPVGLPPGTGTGPTSPAAESRYSHADEPVKVPKSVFFIVGNEFCERFTFYGIKAILYIYLTRPLQIGSDTATALVHTFNMMAYTFTLVGGWLSDSYLGRFRTIVYLSLVYCVGNVVLSVTAIPGVMPTRENGAPQVWGTMLGLLLLAFGTGGIKPCVSAFGGDQFDPWQTRAISLFFSMFYFSINSGSLLSMIMTPVLRSQSCFGQDSCFSLAFGVPSLLMLVSTLIFIAGKATYKQQPPAGNILGRVFAVIGAARKNKARNPSVAKAHWIDYAALDSRFDARFVKDVKQLLSVLWVLLPLPVFWALYDQQGSRWTSQALLMKSDMSLFGFKFEIKPDQMQVTNALLILAFIPLFQQVVYPRVRWLDRPLRRIALGMVFTGCSFLLSALLQSVIQAGTFSKLGPDGTRVLVPDILERRTLAENGLLQCDAGCVPILWQVPQYIVITAGEIMFSITGLEFAYAQSPTSLKSVCQAAWQMTVAAGNLIVIIIAESHFFEPLYEILFFAVCIFLAAALFVFMSRGFVEMSPDTGDSPSEPTSPLHRSESALLSDPAEDEVDC